MVGRKHDHLLDCKPGNCSRFGFPAWQDACFALVVSNESGYGGANLRRTDSPHYQTGRLLCTKHHQGRQREHESPVDLHMRMVLIAPQPLYIASASEDPKGEFLAAKHASSVYRLFDHPIVAWRTLTVTSDNDPRPGRLRPELPPFWVAV